MAALIITPALAWAQEQPSVTPYRPGVSTPAELSAPGWLEIEAGVQFDRGERSARRDSLPFTLKLAFTPDWGIRLDGSAWQRQADAAGQSIGGIGDSSIVLKRRFAVDAGHSFGLEVGATLPTGRKGISSGKSAYSINGIYSADRGDYHTDINLMATRLGAMDPGAGRVQTLWAASLSKALNERWSVGGELSGTRQKGSDSTSQLLVAASYNVSKSVTLDAGMARRLRSRIAGVPDWSLFSGVTLLAGRLF